MCSEFPPSLCNSNLPNTSRPRSARQATSYPLFVLARAPDLASWPHLQHKLRVGEMPKRQKSDVVRNLRTSTAGAGLGQSAQYPCGAFMGACGAPTKGEGRRTAQGASARDGAGTSA